MTSGTKTRALCVATRCTSVDQFVATFYRFSGDDQSFFIATMTSRPIGLETAFAIQLADKQPVLRGLCVVLDAWETADNRFKRPGIRLGIRRLTADSQLVFERLRAAARSSAPEGSPLPGPLPTAPVVRPPQFALRQAPTPLPPAPGLPLKAPERKSEPRIEAPKVEAKIEAPKIEAPKVEPPKIEPPKIEAKPGRISPTSFTSNLGAAKPPGIPSIPSIAKPGAIPAIPSLAMPSIAPPVPVGPPVDPVPPAPIEAVDEATEAAAEAANGATNAEVNEPAVARAPTPIEVTRFQVALNATEPPPPVTESDLRSKQVLRRSGNTQVPRIISDPSPDDLPVEPGQPAMIIDRPSGEHAPIAPPPAPPVETRTPGSSLILPANPLQNLSDESLEGFVDCTLYEDTGNFVAPDGPWADELADPPLAPLATRGPSVPAMPFDTPPDLTVRSIGDTESLRVAPELAAAPAPVADMPLAAAPVAPRAATEPPALGVGASGALFAPQHDRASEPWLDAVAAQVAAAPAHSIVPGFAPPLQLSAAPPTPLASGVLPVLSSGSYPQVPDAAFAPPGDAAYPVLDDAAYIADAPYAPVADAPYAGDAPYAPVADYVAQPPDPHAHLHRPLPHAAHLVGFGEPTLSARRTAPAWQRAVLIGSVALIAIILAFVLAKRVRDDAAPTAAPHSEAPAAPRAEAPPPARIPEPAPAPARAANLSVPRADIAAAVKPPEPEATELTNLLTAEEDGESAGTAVVGHGPCRIAVATTPAGSIIRLDDQTVGPSPITIAASCDKHKIDAAHARYQSASRVVTLVAGKPADLELSLARPIHAVTVTSSPSGAELSIDGHRAGVTPTIIQMMGFATVKLTFSKPGFAPVTKRVYSKVAQDRVFVKLSR